MRESGQSRKMSSINLNHRLGLSSWEPRKSCSRWPMNRLHRRGPYIGAHGHPLDLEEMSGVKGEVVEGKDKL